MWHAWPLRSIPGAPVEPNRVPIKDPRVGEPLCNEWIVPDEALSRLSRREDPHGSGPRIGRRERSERDQLSPGLVEGMIVGLMAREHLAHPRPVHALAQAVQHDEVHRRIVARATTVLRPRTNEGVATGSALERRVIQVSRLRLIRGRGSTGSQDALE